MYKTSTAFNQAIKNGERIYVKVKCGNFIFGYNDETDPTSPNEQNNIMELNIDRSISHDDYALAKSYSCGCNCVLWAVPAGAVLRAENRGVLWLYGQRCSGVGANGRVLSGKGHSVRRMYHFGNVRPHV